jgi:hypothetical protein
VKAERTTTTRGYIGKWWFGFWVDEDEERQCTLPREKGESVGFVTF